MNKITRKLILILIMFALILLGTTTILKAEEVDITDDLFNENEEFRISEENIQIDLNSTYRLGFYNKPSEGTLTFSSANPNIVTVDEFGEITAKQVGTTTVTATVGRQTATCKVTVVYGGLEIKSDLGKSVVSTTLVLGEHPTEKLVAKVTDGKYEEVENAVVGWESSDPNVVVVDNGKITAVSAGKATITAISAGVFDTCEVTVGAAPKFTDFSKAKYELLFDSDTDLKISNINPKDKKTSYYYIITAENKKPTIHTRKSGGLDTDKTTEAKYLSINLEKKYLYALNLDKYVELNQDLYLWVIEDVGLDEMYTVNRENYISHSTKFVVEGQKLKRPQLPQLNLILKSFNIWGGKKAGQDYTYIDFRFPSAVENRKFKLKVGKVTDKSILQKIQKNDYTGITELLTYAKNNKAIYTKDLTTTIENYYSTKDALFDGIKLLDHKAYYYIYVEFDDENGKYYPVEGVTLGQAWIGSTKEYWNLWAYTAGNFEWNNLSSSYTDDKKEEVKEETKEEAKDDTVAKDKLPNTGIRMVLIISILALTGTTVFFKIKGNKYKGI